MKAQHTVGDDLIIFVPVAIRAIMQQLLSGIEAAAGKPVDLEFDLNPAIAERIASGQRFDIALTNPQYLAALIDSGRVDAQSHRAFGRVPLAIAAKAGAMTGPRSTEIQQIAAVLHAADSIAYTGAGTSGRLFLEVAQRIGAADAVASRGRAMPGGAPVQSVIAGESSIAIAPLTSILATPGLVAMAVFPDTLGTHIDMSVFLAASARPGAARVLDFLTAAERDGELAAAGVARFTLD
jgi:ABC-type molybdate transport system substrate-binding protein